MLYQCYNEKGQSSMQDPPQQGAHPYHPRSFQLLRAGVEHHIA